MEKGYIVLAIIDGSGEKKSVTPAADHKSLKPTPFKTRADADAACADYAKRYPKSAPEVVPVGGAR